MTDSLADIHDVALLDLDGVVYVGEHAVPHAVDGLAAARAHGMVLTFVTNNASRPSDVVAEHLTGLGVSAAADEVVTSAQAGAALMVKRLGTGAAVLAVGGPGVTEALLAADLAPVHADVNGRVGAVGGVLQGFGRAVAWSDLCAAALAVQDGAVWIATNPDMSLPIVGGRAPGNGALVAAVAAAVGREPDDIAGKPFPALMRASMDRTHAVRPLVVGDRLDTDIAGAHAVAVPSLLVFTGVSDVEAVLTAPAGQRPTYLGADLGALTATPRATTGGDREAHATIPAPERHDSWWTLAGSRARVRDGVLEVEIHGTDWLSAVQCGCAAAWSADSVPHTGAAATSIEAVRRTVGS